MLAFSSLICSIWEVAEGSPLLAVEYGNFLVAPCSVPALGLDTNHSTGRLFQRLDINEDVDWGRLYFPYLRLQGCNEGVFLDMSPRLWLRDPVACSALRHYRACQHFLRHLVFVRWLGFAHTRNDRPKPSTCLPARYPYECT